mmetsp:Transcript_48126/g.157536  ORF Transcript_48126/g.157536 Transcript_48126/m.157536 type:complete len:298 (-) Transcript_48126:423-1316(-)
MTGGSLRQIIAVRHAILHLAEHIGCTLAVQARLQRFDGAPADFARDRDELAAAIRDWTAQAAQADEPVTGSFSVLGLPRQRLRGFKPRAVEWARPIPAEGVVVGRAMTLALHRACGTLQRGELAAALRQEVTAALEPLAESGTASAASRLRARITGRALVHSALQLLQSRAAVPWSAYTGRDNAEAAEAEAAEAAEEAAAAAEAAAAEAEAAEAAAAVAEAEMAAAAAREEAEVTAAPPRPPARPPRSNLAPAPASTATSALQQRCENPPATARRDQPPLEAKKMRQSSLAALWGRP